ncbi:MAG: acyltransferase [Bacteroidales bacterium]
MHKRIEWVDSAKAIGMFLVFYSHYIERVNFVGNNTTIAFNQLQVIFSFHMPFFFMVAGFFAKQHQQLRNHFKKLFLTRIIPVFSFAVLCIPVWLLYFKVTSGSFQVETVVKKGLFYLSGSPQLDFVTWFLICLFTTELLAAVFGLPAKSKWVSLSWGMFFLFAGFFINKNIDFFILYTNIGKNFWYIHESILALGFYLIGNGMYPIISEFRENKHKLIYALIPLWFSLLILFNNNNFTGDNVVIMANSEHGSLLPFLLNAFSGAILLISLGIIIPTNKTLSFIGKNSLLFLGLNGLFHHFLNIHIAKFFLLNNFWWSITLNCILITLISMAACYPVIIFINKYLPQLFGKPTNKDPFLPNLDNLTPTGFQTGTNLSAG